MSWVRAAAELRNEEDVFDEDDDEMNLLQRDWRRSMEKRLKEGYVEGVDAGKENSLQSGFNLGYKLGVNMMKPCGELRGSISALSSWCLVYKLDPSLSRQLGDLLTAINQCEEHMVKGLSSVHQAAHSAGLSDCMQDMGLGKLTHEGSRGSCDGGQDCCCTQGHLSSSLLSCRTTKQLNSAMKYELCRILKDTYSVAQKLNVPIELLSYLQTLEVKYLQV